MKRTGLNSLRSWIVAISCGIIYCFCSTVYRLAAIFYAAFVQQYGIDRKSASIPFVVLGFVRCSSGSIYGLLAERFGRRRMCLVGCCLAVLGLVASFFAQDVIALSVTIGLMYGFGMTCTALLPTVIRSHFDDTSTTISNAIVTVGPSVCAIAFPGVIMYFLEAYGVAGALLLSSGILLNSFPLIMLIKESGNNASKIKSTVAQCNEVCDSIPKLKNTQKALVEKHQGSKPVSFSNINTESEECRESQRANDRRRVTSSIVDKQISKCLLHNPYKCTCLSLTQKEYRLETISEPISIEADPTFKVSNLTNTTYNKPEMIQMECNTTCDSTTGDKEKNKSLFHVLAVLKDPTFIVLTLIQGMAVYTYHVWLTTFIDYSRDKEIDQSYEIYILTLNPVTDIIGRLGLAFVTDKGYLSTANFGALTFLSVSAASILIALSKSFAMMALSVMLMTFANGAFINISPGMSYAYIEKDKQILVISSYGSLYAPLSFTVSPLIGYFREKLGSYDGLYYLLATINFACSLIVLMLPKLANMREKRKHTSTL